MPKVYVLKHTLEDSGEHDPQQVTETDKVLVTIEGDINTSIETWLKDFGGFVVGIDEGIGKPQFNLTPDEWFECD
ncbi:hypothetical protein [Nostoc sp. FACHB-888]|uniref:hypothetical protein n=1 Tax=Nostoc sp. FACHB-888 TaxID=2692842 RepID=UPI0016855D39|nr:hypothetical protein [Nostoc sp. FACHB-888]MBD2243213.1 hypothetical protein [Nostoc sp. FACHB-888]